MLFKAISLGSGEVQRAVAMGRHQVILIWLTVFQRDLHYRKFLKRESYDIIIRNYYYISNVRPEEKVF